MSEAGSARPGRPAWRSMAFGYGFPISLLLLYSLVAIAAEPAPAIEIPQQRTEPARIVYPASKPASFVLPDGRQEIIRSMLNVPRKMNYGDFAWDDKGIAEGKVWVRVDLARQILSVFRGGHEIGSAVITYGAGDHPTPGGTFPILEKKKDHRSSVYDADMPYMLRLTSDGVAIHASDVRIGRATHGCIGVPRAFARRLYEQVRHADEVTILPQEGGSSSARIHL